MFIIDSIIEKFFKEALSKTIGYDIEELEDQVAKGTYSAIKNALSTGNLNEFKRIIEMDKNAEKLIYQVAAENSEYNIDGFKEIGELYAAVLNEIVSICASAKGSFVIEGFFNNENAIVYFNKPTFTESYIPYKYNKYDRCIKIDHNNPDIYILDDENMNVSQLNTEIEKTKYKELEKYLFRKCKRVEEISDYEIKLFSSFSDQPPLNIEIENLPFKKMMNSAVNALYSRKKNLNTVGQNWKDAIRNTTTSSKHT